MKSVRELEGDSTLLGGFLWHLYLAVQGCINIALKTISKLSLRTPESYADAFTVLSEEKLIPEELAKKLTAMARFRHILAHVYTKIDLDRVHAVLHHNLADIKEFLKVLATKLQEKKIDVSQI
ncbi:MAG: DUF86 domain-containing protein [Candidatus Freyarchaeota archaeon]|nr:DUF86 domain-containing protein [Candidatus Jordarchaeia archaeon]